MLLNSCYSILYIFLLFKCNLNAVCGNHKIPGLNSYATYDGLKSLKKSVSLINNQIDYVGSLLLEIIENEKIDNINFAHNQQARIQFPNKNFVFLFGYNIEHCIVGYGSNFDQSIRITRLAPAYFKYSNITVMNGSNRKYIVRLPNAAQYIQDDIIIEYSNTNLYLLKQAMLTTVPGMEFLVKKMVYIAPVNSMLYLPWNYSEQDRYINTLTTFYNSNSIRRNNILKLLNGMKHTNMNSTFGEEAKNVLYHTKILINVHQTEYHHTFEEFRVLPALLSGVIVISEESPFSDEIPYKDAIIFVKYSEIVEKTKYILAHYDQYYHSIYHNTTIVNILQNLHKDNYDRLKAKVLTTIATYKEKGILP